LPILAAFLHEGLTALAVIAIVVLSLARWHSGHLLLQSYVALAVVVTLVVGCGLGRACLRRINQISGDDDVSALLREAYNHGLAMSHPRALSPVLQAVIPVQIVVTAAVALALVFLIQQPALSFGPKQVSAGSSQAVAPTGTQGQPGPAPVAREAPPTPQPAGDADSEWTMWPAVVAIALSEIMYIGWMFEGEAVADELAVVSRRWTRRRTPEKQTPVADPIAEATPTAAAARAATLTTALLAAATLAAATLTAAAKDAGTKDAGASDTQAPEPGRTGIPPPSPAVVDTAVAALAATLAAATLAAGTPDAAPPERSLTDTPPPGPAEVEAAVAPVRRALYLCTLLHQYGVDLTPEDAN
jgi:hypothetical protein